MHSDNHAKMMDPTVIVEVTENCNLACTFCLRPSFTPPVMARDILEKVISHVIESSERRADFVWHGGEPLLAGLDFFRDACRFQKEHNARGVVIRNNLQTNGTTLNEDAVKFLEQEGFEIGTSLQGTQATHDAARVTVRKKPTYDIVISKISRLQRKPGSIVVLTTDLLGKEEEIYWSTKQHVRGMRVSEYFPGGLNPRRHSQSASVSVNGVPIRDDRPTCPSTMPSIAARPEPLMPTPHEYGHSMLRFYEVWKQDPDPMDLRPITEIIRSFVVGKSEGCLYSQDACAHSVIAVKANGDFYTCIRGAPDEQFRIGHVDEQPLKGQLVESARAKARRVEKLMEGPCGTCQFWSYCNGGCPLESLKLYGDLDHRTWYCEGRKLVFERIRDDLYDLEPA